MFLLFVWATVWFVLELIKISIQQLTSTTKIIKDFTDGASIFLDPNFTDIFLKSSIILNKKSKIKNKDILTISVCILMNPVISFFKLLLDILKIFLDKILALVNS